MAKSKQQKANVKELYARCEYCSGLKVILDQTSNKYFACDYCQQLGIRLVQREINYLNVPIKAPEVK